MVKQIFQKETNNKAKKEKKDRESERETKKSFATHKEFTNYFKVFKTSSVVQKFRLITVKVFDLSQLAIS